VDCVKVLLEESDADLNMKTKMGKTARDLAMLQKHTSVVAMLDAHLKRGRTRPQEAKRAPNVIVSANVKNQWSKPAALKAVMSGSQPVTTLNRGVSAEVKAPVRQMQRQNSAPEPVALTQADFDEAYALSQELCELTKRNANLDIYLQAHPEVDVNLFRDGLGQTALHNATYRKRIDSVRSLLEYNADVNQTKKNGWSSLNEAAGNGHSDILELLIDHGADLNHKNNSGWTGIHLAVRKGHMQCISVLIRAGCDLTVRTPKGDTPRELASTMKGKDIVAFFDREKKLYDQERKLNPPAPAPAPVQQPVQVPVQVPVLPAQPQQPIGMTRQQQQQQHQLRKQHPAMELSRQLFELTARNDQNAAMQLLREQPKVNPNLYRDDQGVTSLHRASANGNDVLMSVLLTAKANVNLQSPDGLSPIHRCANNNSACARLLLEKKANVELQSERGATGLMHASMAGNQGVVLTLLESGASVSQTDNDGQQALHYCGLVGATPVAQMLLEARADVNAQDARGDTALHTVSKQANFPRNTASFVDLLIRANVDTGRKNNLGQSARDLCAMRKDLVDVKLRLDSLSQQNQHQQLLDSFMQPVNANSPQGHQVRTRA
jgi:ankyrin repeat protein